MGNALEKLCVRTTYACFVREHEGRWDQAFWGSPVCTKALSCEVITWRQKSKKLILAGVWGVVVGEGEW